MDVMERTIGRFPVGVWLALVAVLLLLLAGGMQAYSLADWEGAVELGLQNEPLDGTDEERALARGDRGVALADMVWLLPLCVLALVGLLRRWESAGTTTLMALSVGVYFPLIFTFQRWDTYPGTVVLALVLWTVPSLLGIVGLWCNRGHFTKGRA